MLFRSFPRCTALLRRKGASIPPCILSPILTAHAEFRCRSRLLTSQALRHPTTSRPCAAFRALSRRMGTLQSAHPHGTTPTPQPMDGIQEHRSLWIVHIIFEKCRFLDLSTLHAYNTVDLMSIMFDITSSHTPAEVTIECLPEWL